MLLILLAQFVVAQGSPFALAAGSRLWIEGDSNLHPWSCKATALEVSVDVDAESAQIARGLTVRVPVAGLECGDGHMNDKLRDAMKADAHPIIEYKLISAERLPGEATKLKATGALTIAGKTREVTFVVDAALAGDGSAQAAGAVPISMTDYGVQPPTALLVLKTYDLVTVKFDIRVMPHLQPHASQP